MRSIECGLGALVMAAALAFASGMVHRVMPMPPFGGGAMFALFAAGVLLFAHGWIGRKMARDPDNVACWRAASRAVFATGFALAIMVAVAGLMPVLDLFVIGGFPLGFYLAAQGGVIALAVLAFRAADRLDDADHSDQASLYRASLDRGEA